MLRQEADVEVARQLVVEDEHVAVVEEPLGDDHLLLVAAREQPHRPVGMGDFYGEPLDE